MEFILSKDSVFFHKLNFRILRCEEICASASNQARYERGLKRDFTKKVNEQESEKAVFESISSCSPVSKDNTYEPFQITESFTTDYDDIITEGTNHEHCLSELERLEEKVGNLTLE